MSQAKIIEFSEVVKNAQDALNYIPMPEPEVEELSMGEVAEELSKELEFAEGLDEELSDEIGSDSVEVITFSEEGEGAEEEENKSMDSLAIPGSDFVQYEEPEPEPEPEKNWADDRDVSKFMEYIVASYPDGIPRHDGYSMTGCERAYNYLNRLNKEISEAIRMDNDDNLEPEVLEDVRVKIMRDMIMLKDRLSQLRKEVKDKNKKASEEPDDLVKEATTPKIQLVATPFERAIAGIIINSVISAGHPFEDVYEFLKDKYDLSERDELSILQLVMDSGHHIFKDRGMIGEDKGKDGDKPKGLDFLKNYFA